MESFHWRTLCYLYPSVSSHHFQEIPGWFRKEAKIISKSSKHLHCFTACIKHSKEDWHNLGGELQTENYKTVWLWPTQLPLFPEDLCRHWAVGRLEVHPSNWNKPVWACVYFFFQTDISGHNRLFNYVIWLRSHFTDENRTAVSLEKCWAEILVCWRRGRCCSAFCLHLNVFVLSE